MEEHDCDYNISARGVKADSLHPNDIKQFEKMLQKAVRQMSDHITESLTKEICELGQCTSDLENRIVESNVQSYICELENLKEGNLNLQTCLEDFENRACHSNLHILGLFEAIVDLQSTMTVLFQELQPSIPVERLELDRITGL